jgi:dTDP-4-dehydrorhamnose reductase
MSSEYPTAAKRPKYSVLDTKKTQKTFSFKAPDWEDSLKLCLSKL